MDVPVRAGACRAVGAEGALSAGLLALVVAAVAAAAVPTRRVPAPRVVPAQPAHVRARLARRAQAACRAMTKRTDEALRQRRRNRNSVTRRPPVGL